MTELLLWDTQLFQLINHTWTNSLFDFILPILRNKYTWFPFYIFLLAYIFLNHVKNSAYLIVAIALSVGIADATSSHLIKKTVKRLRPCKVLQQPNDMTLRVRCGSGYSFPSSHAANHFSMAVILILLFGKDYKWLKYCLLLWAFSIAYAQVYVGVHYPIDICIGALLGAAIAFTIGRIYSSWQSYLVSKEQSLT